MQPFAAEEDVVPFSGRRFSSARFVYSVEWIQWLLLLRLCQSSCLCYAAHWLRALTRRLSAATGWLNKKIGANEASSSSGQCSVLCERRRRRR